MTFPSATDIGDLGGALAATCRPVPVTRSVPATAPPRHRPPRRPAQRPAAAPSARGAAGRPAPLPVPTSALRPPAGPQPVGALHSPAPLLRPMPPDTGRPGRGMEVLAEELECVLDGLAPPGPRYPQIAGPPPRWPTSRWSVRVRAWLRCALACSRRRQRRSRGRWRCGRGVAAGSAGGWRSSFQTRPGWELTRSAARLGSPRARVQWSVSNPFVWAPPGAVPPGQGLGDNPAAG